MITIVGVGALGSHVALALRGMELRVIDFDTVEQKNILAQFHTKMTLRRNKAQALAQTFHALFGIIVEAIPYRLNPGNAVELLADSQLVLDCTDNLETRKIISMVVRAKNIPCLHGATSADGTFARIVWDELFVPDQETGDGATCEDGRHLPFFVHIASQMAIQAQQFLNGKPKSNYQVTPYHKLQL